MQRYLDKIKMFFDLPLDLRNRVFVLLGAALLIPSFFLPLWNMSMYSSRYPDGLSLSIYPHKLKAAKSAERDDLLEINALNHFIGMKQIDKNSFSQFHWLSFLFGVVIIFALRAFVVGRMAKLVEIVVLMLYTSLFALWTFKSTLNEFGHNLNPYAIIKVEPFSPPLFGDITVAQVTISSGPGIGVLNLLIVIGLFATPIIKALFLLKNKRRLS